MSLNLILLWVYVSLARAIPLPILKPLRGERNGLDNCLYSIRSIPPDSGGTYLTCITYVGGCGLLRSWEGSNVCVQNTCSSQVKVD